MGSKVKTLELSFVTELNKTATISIEQPKEPIDVERVKAAMDTIIQQGALTSKSGKLVAKKDVRLIERTVNDYSL
ncbi:DUF2922 domain-containing protein [Bacillus testis]|uniref:DUF2922 domain-containing protein n=1 Tax=Bacillus testis TaxID=1622072 RepID=UPI00067F3731|nr:DUF2922 domain-containing protein [Bacillus testis]